MLKFILVITLSFLPNKHFSVSIKSNERDNQEKAISRSDLETPYSIEIKKDVIFTSNDEVLFGTIYPVYVDSNNRVFVGDADQTQIHVFEPNGDYLTSLGREGRGPGEFSGITTNTTISTDSTNIYITDTQRFFPHRMQVFSLEDFSFVKTVKLIAENRSDFKVLEGYYPMKIFPKKDGTFLVSYQQTPHQYKENMSFIRYVVQNSSGEIISLLNLEQKNRKNFTYLVKGEYSYLAIQSFPFLGRSLFSVSKENLYYTARSEDFKIDILYADGTYLKSISHNIEKRKLSKKELLDSYKTKENRYTSGNDVALKMIEQSQDLPEEWPVLEQMFFDDENRLWVSTIVENNEIYEWWILESSGEVITKFEWSRDKPIQQIRNEYLYTKEKDEEGADIVVRYSFEIKK